MDKVKALLAAGASLPNAVRDALGGRSLARVAIENGIHRSELYSTLSGARVASQKTIDVLVAELGGTPDEWRLVLADVMQRRALAV